MKASESNEREALFRSAEWYDRSVNWAARLTRELPVLIGVFGPPGAGGLVDAGCGTGHQACALAQKGYRVVGVDVSAEMLEVAREHGRRLAPDVDFACTPYATMHDYVGSGFDGLLCIGNSLAAAGTAEAAAEAIDQFARCLRPGGRLFLQILNFEPMRDVAPCVRGPRVTIIDGVEYVSLRHFHFGVDSVQVTNFTVWNDGGWKHRAHRGTLYPIAVGELAQWCGRAGLRIDDTWGSYAREPFDLGGSDDLLVAATRV
jgi:SAM-dependent methyltransferase